MTDLSIHPGRSMLGLAYNPRLSRNKDKNDNRLPITEPAKDRTKGKLGKAIRKLEERRKWFNGLSTVDQASHTMPGSMKG